MISMRFYQKVLLFAGLFLTLSANAATYLTVIGPVSKTVYNAQSIYLGKVGPGESFYVLANPNTTSPNGNYINIGWDTLQAVNLTGGWSSQSSPLYENPMKMKITVAPSAQYGTYAIELRAVNIQNYSGLGNLTFFGYVNVTPDVFVVQVSPTSLSSGIGQPVNLYMTINNTGISDDPFIISARGLPAWNVSQEVISLHATKNTFTYPIFQNEPGVYKFNLTVEAATSSLIAESYPVSFTVQESLLNDYTAVGNGIGLSPIIFEPAYAFMSTLSYLYRVIVHLAATQA
jgi:hypothetical protein